MGRDTLATKLKVDTLHKVNLRLCRRFVESRLSTVADSFDLVDRVMVNIVAKAEHVQLSRLVESG